MGPLSAAAALEKDLAAALLAGGDTRKIRARLAALRVEAAQAADAAVHAAATLQADFEQALAADAAMRVSASRAALTARMAQLQPPPNL